ncbi:MAG: glutathione S-transferase family protein [Alphaproteobacteria bacterium]|nr:glutathione S-transferase family protein [Alphaproteobacteria bacterium]
MGFLVNGEWSTDGTVFASAGGAFERKQSSFRNWVTPDGTPGPTGTGGFAAEAGRYHLYVAMACPWAHRTLIFRALKELETLIPVSVVDPKMPDEHGWMFTGENGSTNDAVNGARTMWQVYLTADPRFSGRATVPVLWDKKTGTIVSNESADIIRMFNSAFDGLTGNAVDFYPAPLRNEIDAVNARVYDSVNNGVYKTGFATRQAAYDEAVTALFDTLDWLEARLDRHDYLVGDTLTEADWRLFTTLVRFDAVYHGHFKCSRRRIADYKNLSRLLKRLYRHPGVAETVDLDAIRTHYYWSHASINPHRIVPIMPDLPFLRG